MSLLVIKPSLLSLSLKANPDEVRCDSGSISSFTARILSKFSRNASTTFGSRASPPPFLPDYSYSNPNWARVFIGTTRRQRIEHIRQIHDPADNGDVLALQALRVAVTVPFLMVGQGDRVRQPDDLGIRSFENLGTIERVVFTSANSSSVSLPGLRRILSEMPIFPTSCMGEA